MEILIAIIILAVGAFWYYNAQLNKVVAREDSGQNDKKQTAPEVAKAMAVTVEVPVEGAGLITVADAPKKAPRTTKPRATAKPAAIKAVPAKPKTAAKPKAAPAKKPTRTKKV